MLEGTHYPNMKLHLAVVLVALAPLALARVPNIYDVSHSHTHVRAGNAHPKDVKATAPKIRNVVHAPVSAKKFTEIRARDILPTKKQWSPDTAFEDDDLASPEDFEKYANKGGALLCAMLGTDRTAGRLLQDARDPPSAASIWRGNLVEELKTWFWHHVPNKDCMIGWDLDHAFESLGLSSESTEYSGDNECIWVEHQEPGRGNVMMQFYEVNGKQYRVSPAVRCETGTVSISSVKEKGEHINNPSFRQLEHTTPSPSTAKAAPSSVSTSRPQSAPQNPSGTTRKETQTKPTCPPCAPSPTCSGASGCATIPM
jgi:hypothetical protein